MPKSPPPSDLVVYGPSAWKDRKRPVLPDKPTYSQRTEQLMFDVLFAGAKASKHWEDEWPLMTHEEFASALFAVSKIELGGQFPNGAHPRAE